MKKASEVTCLFVDSGIFVEMAVVLARTFKKVYYTCPGGMQTAYPTLNHCKIGEGLEGVEVISGIFGDHFDDIDLFVFPDINYGPIQVYLESIGKTVWGARMGEELEYYREDVKKLMKKKGLPVGPYKVIKGMKALCDHLEKNKDQHVKMDVYRGSFESFFCADYKEMESKITEIGESLGDFKDEQEFVVEDDLPDKVELGIDAWTIDGEYPKNLLSGIEIKDKGYVGIFKAFKDLPEPLTRWNIQMSDVLENYGYRGFLSTEVRIGEDHEPYLIDVTARAPAPPNELAQEFYLNLAEIIWQGANGIMVEPEPMAKYGAEIIICSDWADCHFQTVKFPPALRKYVKLRYGAKINGNYVVIPQHEKLKQHGACIGFGDTMEEACNMAKDVAEQVSGYGLDIRVDALNDAEEQIEKANEMGLRMFE